MLQISPSILAADFACLGDYMRRADMSGTDMFHVDVMDGMFVPNISFGIPIMDSIKKITHKPLDVHLMIVQPERYIREFARVGADIITVHYEACDDVNVAAALIHESGCKAGLAIKPGTETTVLEPYLEQFDMFLVMTVEPGFGGQKYMRKCTKKLTMLREMLNEYDLDTDIEVDGGITRENIGTVLDAGANVIVVGSSMFKGDIEDNMKYYRRYFEEYSKGGSEEANRIMLS